MEKEPKISIIIPVWNAEKYLNDTINSVLNQTYGNFEVVCVNDGSTDNSLNILKEFQKKDKRVVVIDQKNQGGSGARNTGLDNATGDYIAFLDNDDIYHPQYLEILYYKLKENDADLVVCDNEIFKDGTDFKFTTKFNVEKIKTKRIFRKPFFQKYVMRKKIPMLMWLKLGKKEIYKDIRFSTKLPAINDILLNMEVLYNSHKCVTIGEKLIAWRLRIDSQTTTKITEKKLNEFYNLILELNNFKKHELNFLEKWTINRMIAKYVYNLFISDRIKDGTNIDYKDKIKEMLSNMIEQKLFNPKFLTVAKYIKFKCI